MMTNFELTKNLNIEQMAEYLTYLIICSANNQIQGVDAFRSHPDRQQVYDGVLEMLKSEVCE